MNMHFAERTCTSSPRRSSALGLIGALTLSLGGCLLVGIEPDEVDVAVDETGEANDTSQGTDGADEVGDGDPTGDPTGDGDPAGDGDGDPGDGDGDPGGDGDGDELAPCVEFRPVPVVDGENPIDVPPGNDNSFAGNCGGQDGPDEIFSYTATADGLFSFALSQAEFDGVIYLIGGCDPLDEWSCDAQVVETLMTVGQTVYVIVDSNQAGVGGTATLTITGP